MARPRIQVARNEVDERYDYHCDALASYLPDAEEFDYPKGERVDLTDADAVVLTGSTAGAYERGERPWITELERLVRDVIVESIPTLGVCFGHQLVNQSLGGRVTHVGTTSKLVRVSLDADPLFEGINSVIPAVHGDRVTRTGEHMRVIASTDHAEIFATRHERAPLWTVQWHPEFTEDMLHHIERDFGWTETEFSFADVNSERIYENFIDIVASR